MSEDHHTPTLFLLDGHALIYRAFFAMISRPLTTSSGENTSAPFGIARFLVRLIDDHDPDYVGFVLDAGDSYRTEMFPEYKATREKMPDEMAVQLDDIRELVKEKEAAEDEGHRGEEDVQKLTDRRVAEVDAALAAGSLFW